MDCLTINDVRELNEMEFTKEGYVVANGYYYGLKNDGWAWYGNYELCMKEAKPILNVPMIKEIKKFIDNDLLFE